MILQPPGSAPQQASSAHQPEAAIRQFLDRLKMPCRLLVAYSGGGDSTGLLVGLDAMAPAYPGVEIFAATVDHGLRAGSTEEAENAGVLCQRLNISHTVLTWRGAKPATGIQAAARSARYRLLTEYALGIKADFILTAHNLDDDRETLAMKQARNPAARDGIADAVLVERSIWVLRPLLGLTRVDIRAYLSAKGIGWVEDPSNDNPAFERVRVRQSLLDDHMGGDPAEPTADHASDASAFIAQCVHLHPGMVAEIDLGTLDANDPAHRLALLSVAAFLGGRDHLAGQDSADRIFDFLSSGEKSRLTAERVVFDRRKQSLFIGREARGLNVIVIEPGEAAYWDNRFHISNSGNSAVRIGPDPGSVTPLIAPPIDGSLPASAFQRAIATLPCLQSGESSGLRVRVVMPQFEHFIPVRRRQIAESLAFLAGLQHLPLLSLG